LIKIRNLGTMLNKLSDRKAPGKQESVWRREKLIISSWSWADAEGGGIFRMPNQGMASIPDITNRMK